MAPALQSPLNYYFLHQDQERTDSVMTTHLQEGRQMRLGLDHRVDFPREGRVGVRKEDTGIAGATAQIHLEILERHQEPVVMTTM